MSYGEGWHRGFRHHYSNDHSIPETGFRNRAAHSANHGERTTNQRITGGEEPTAALEIPYQAQGACLEQEPELEHSEQRQSKLQGMDTEEKQVADEKALATGTDGLMSWWQNLKGLLAALVNGATRFLW